MAEPLTPREILTDGPQDGPVLLLAHGAGAPMDSGWMQEAAGLLAQRGVRVLRFEFPYMAERRRGTTRRGPDPAPRLLQCWREVARSIGNLDRIALGGKSLGGRMASMVVEELGARALVCLGYPFHPPGRPENLRTAHLQDLSTPALFLQGERDPFGARDEVASYGLSDKIRVHWLPDGDHSFKPRKASGRTLADNLAEAADATARFLGA